MFGQEADEWNHKETAPGFGTQGHAHVAAVVTPRVHPHRWQDQRGHHRQASNSRCDLVIVVQALGTAGNFIYDRSSIQLKNKLQYGQI